jgi:hypothetical protein
VAGAEYLWENEVWSFFVGGQGVAADSLGGGVMWSRRCLCAKKVAGTGHHLTQVRYWTSINEQNIRSR